MDTLILPYCESLKAYKHYLSSSKNIRLIFSYSNTIRKNLIVNKPSNENSAGGVYRVPCKMCNKFYIGETIKTLETRLKQHKYAVRTANNNNAIFRHMQDEDHQIDWDSSSFLFKSNKKDILQMVESILITKIPNFNLSPGFYTVPENLRESILKLIQIHT
jgi:hypothetical protein